MYLPIIVIVILVFLHYSIHADGQRTTRTYNVVGIQHNGTRYILYTALTKHTCTGLELVITILYYFIEHYLCITSYTAASHLRSNNHLINNYYIKPVTKFNRYTPHEQY